MLKSNLKGIHKLLIIFYADKFKSLFISKFSVTFCSMLNWVCDFEAVRFSGPFDTPLTPSHPNSIVNLTSNFHVYLSDFFGLVNVLVPTTPKSCFKCFTFGKFLISHPPVSFGTSGKHGGNVIKLKMGFICGWIGMFIVFPRCRWQKLCEKSGGIAQEKKQRPLRLSSGNCEELLLCFRFFALRLITEMHSSLLISVTINLPIAALQKQRMAKKLILKVFLWRDSWRAIFSLYLKNLKTKWENSIH